MKLRTYLLVIIACSLAAVTAGLSRAEQATSILNPGTESRDTQAGTVSSAEPTQAAQLSARINEIVVLLTTTPTNSIGSVCYNNKSEEAILHQWLRATDQEAARLQTEGRLREALELREEMVRRALETPPGRTPPISVYKFQYMQKLQGLYLQCSLLPEAFQFKAALDNLNALRPAPPTGLRIVEVNSNPNVPAAVVSPSDKKAFVEAARSMARKPAPPSNLRIVVAH